MPLYFEGLFIQVLVVVLIYVNYFFRVAKTSLIYNILNYLILKLKINWLLKIGPLFWFTKGLLIILLVSLRDGLLIEVRGRS